MQYAKSMKQIRKTEKKKETDQKKRVQPNWADPGPNPAKPAQQQPEPFSFPFLFLFTTDRWSPPVSSIFKPQPLLLTGNGRH
jgi:hypothetical protein